MGKTWRHLILITAACHSLARGAELPRMDFTIDGVKRTALVYIPPQAKTEPTPLVFAFHGHGGSSETALNKFAVNHEWPEAISVYMQGLNTPGQLTDPEGKLAGWQKAVGDQGDRDLKFFDAVLAQLEKDCKVDPKRIYVTGHSNGGGFTYLLWLARGDVFAAVAPSAAVGKNYGQIPPKPAILFAGRNDPLVKFAWQELSMKAVKRINGCAETGEPWDTIGTIYPSKGGTPLVTCIFDGGHQFAPNQPALTVKFFKEHPKP